MKTTAARRLLLSMSGLLAMGATVVGTAPASGAATAGAAYAGAGSTSAPTAYITNNQQGTVSVLRGAKVIGNITGVGPGPARIAVTPDDETAYVADFGYINAPGDTVTPIDLATRTAGTPITVGSRPFAIAITPNGLYAVVTLLGVEKPKGGEVVRITLAGGAVSKPVKVAEDPQSLAISPDGSTAYVGSYGAGDADAVVTPIDIAASHPHALTPIAIPGTAPSALAMAPDGMTLYMTDAAGAQLVPISIPSGVVGPGLDLKCSQEGDPGCSPEALAISSNGATAYVAAAGSAFVLKVALPGLDVVQEDPTGGYPDGVGVADGWVYSADAASNDATIVHDGTVVGSPSIGEYPLGVAVVPPT